MFGRWWEECLQKNIKRIKIWFFIFCSLFTNVIKPLDEGGGRGMNFSDTLLSGWYISFFSRRGKKKQLYKTPLNLFICIFVCLLRGRITSNLCMTGPPLAHSSPSILYKKAWIHPLPTKKWPSETFFKPYWLFTFLRPYVS